jgi:hypothetical protein
LGIKDGDEASLLEKFFEAGFHYIAQAGLKLTIFCLSLLSAGITVVSHHAQLILFK